MPERIRAAVRHAGAVLPDQPAAIVRCILDSLAAGYARTIRDAERLAGCASRWCTSSAAVRRTGSSASSPLTPPGNRSLRGPVEATALGNVLVQARAAGELAGGLAELRKIVAGGTALQRYGPLAPSSR